MPGHMGIMVENEGVEYPNWHYIICGWPFERHQWRNAPQGGSFVMTCACEGREGVHKKGDVMHLREEVCDDIPRKASHSNPRPHF